MSKILFFDMDGTILDTNELWNEIIIKLVGEVNLLKYRQFRYNHSNKGPDGLRDTVNYTLNSNLNTAQVLFSLEKACEDVFREDNVKFIDGFNNFIDKIKSVGYKVGLITNSPNYGLNILRKIKNLDNIFNSNIFNPDMVNYAFKPKPDIHLLAMRTLGVNPGDCLIFEDSEDGILAAKAANIQCCLVNAKEITKNKYPEIRSFSNFANLNLEDITQLL